MTASACLLSAIDLAGSATADSAPDSAEEADIDEIGELLAQIPALASSRFAIEELHGGLTNRNFKLTSADGRRLVLRRSDPQSALLAIDRDCEYRNAMAAASTGVGPAVVGYLPGQGVLIVEWIEAKTFSDADLDDSVNLARVAQACARLHAGPRFVNDFDMFDIQQGYLQIVRERGFRLPAGYLDYEPQVAEIRAALAIRAQPTVPCHNDLLAANIMDDGSRTWLIDYEYAGNNEACFELGDIWSEAALPLPRLAELVDAYYGYHSPALIARARLFALMAKYGWMLWASIQDATSAMDFDFWSWGMEKYDRAVAEFDGPQFGTLITEVRQAI